MCPHSSTFLALVLCLARVLHAQTGTLPPPTIHAEPAAESPLGQCVTVVCRSPAAFDVFRLEKEGGALKPDVSKPTPHDTEARFSFTADKGTEGHYRCLYYRNRAWSDRSATLDLVVTETPGSVGSSPPRTCNSTGDTQTYGDDSNSLDLSTEHVYILVGVSVALFLCLLLLALALLCGQRQKKRKLPSSRGEEQRPQERVSPAVDLEKTPDLPSVDRLPEEDREAPSPTPAAGSPQDVTYAQLDQQVLTQRTARATFPQSVEPTAEASTYASLARR
ncbi:leukocyte-associated immunoglobulin-like receptor 1 isoform X1 [Hyaena hyaena]|uniref:leukocyte-associated immunoglobulin-like receptor 1 isoform X1 n=1 Tax=Hyaena hyaena TaxID=95912 RepID=UPI0019222503|nr:leukocyte-associated immunoglobulin-like receptor 1 isoform X1 [Hyaena hyaena]